MYSIYRDFKNKLIHMLIQGSYIYVTLNSYWKRSNSLKVYINYMYWPTSIFIYYIHRYNIVVRIILGTYYVLCFLFLSMGQGGCREFRSECSHGVAIPTKSVHSNNLQPPITACNDSTRLHRNRLLLYSNDGDNNTKLLLFSTIWYYISVNRWRWKEHAYV